MKPSKPSKNKSGLYTMDEVDTDTVESKWKRVGFASNEMQTDDEIEEDIDEDKSDKKSFKIEELSDSSDIPEELEHEEEDSDEEIPEVIVNEES